MILDTNVLVYAAGVDHPLRGAARNVIEAIHDGDLDATTTVLVLQEFVHVYARRRTIDAAVDAARAYVQLLEPLIAVSAEHLAIALPLIAEHACRPSDALIAAACVERRDQLITADRRLLDLPDIDAIPLASMA